MNLGYALKTARLKRFPNRERTQGWVANEVGISQTYLSQIEKGTKEPSWGIIRDLCRLYDMPIQLVVWMGMDVSDIDRGKKRLFKELKPLIDSLIDGFYNQK